MTELGCTAADSTGRSACLCHPEDCPEGSGSEANLASGPLTAVYDVILFVAFLVLILLSGVFATNVYCRLAYNWCSECGAMNAKRRDRCRKCSAELLATPPSA